MQLNDITNLFKGIEQTSGLPLWAVLTISIVFLFFIFLYGFFIPISIIRIKRKLNNLFNVLSVSREEAQRNLQKQSNRYRWKT